MTLARQDNQMDEDPIVPETPTAPSAAPEPPSPGENPPAASRQPKSAKGGRRPWEELTAENEVLMARVKELSGALRPFAAIPVDPGKAGDAVEYVLTRQARQAKIHHGDVLAARKALGMD